MEKNELRVSSQPYLFKTRAIIQYFKHSKEQIPSVLQRNFYFAFVYRYLNYALEVYANTYKTYLKPQYTIINRILKTPSLLLVKNLVAYYNYLFSSHACLELLKLKPYLQLLHIVIN